MFLYFRKTAAFSSSEDDRHRLYQRQDHLRTNGGRIKRYANRGTGQQRGNGRQFLQAFFRLSNWAD